MMIMQVVMMRDIKANSYAAWQFVPSIGGYLRGLAHEVNTPRDGNILNQAPQDFEVYHVGTFDDATGLVTTFDEKKQLAHCSDLVEQKH